MCIRDRADDAAFAEPLLHLGLQLLVGLQMEDGGSVDAEVFAVGAIEVDVEVGDQGALDVYKRQVYGISTPAELIILPLATKVFLLPSLTHPYAPFLAGIVNSVVIACYSYFAHKKFSFRR